MSIYFINIPWFILFSLNNDIRNIKETSKIRINADKSEIDKVSKSNSVIKWFKFIDSKDQCLFTLFDIESLDLSIFLDLFNKAMKFAITITLIANDDIKLIIHSKKSL